MTTGVVLGIDPGTRKCGFAVLARAGTAPLAMGIEPTATLRERVAELVAVYAPSAIALGAGTNGVETTLRARARYFADHPPRGWRILIPRGMLLPPRPIDDYAALLIAERYLSSRMG